MNWKNSGILSAVIGLCFLLNPPQSLAEGSGRIDRMLQLEQDILDNPIAIAPHKRNYFLLSYYDSDFGDTNDSDPFEEGLSHTEIKFQVSIRFPLWEPLFDDNGYLFAAYTAKSFWQAFNSDYSAPFRDINHEPEILLAFLTDYRILGMHNRALVFAFNHQSNGQSAFPLRDEQGVVLVPSRSRSWNRIYAQAYFEQPSFLWHLKAWYRIPEDEKKHPDDPKGDDNPDLEDYLGNFELGFQKNFGRYSAELTLRNNLKTDNNRGSGLLELEFPLTSKLNGYVQYFHGYGESLLDYPVENKRLGIGISLRMF